MPLVSEGLFTALARACAVIVAAVPIAVGGALVWLAVRALNASAGMEQLPVTLALVAFTLAVSAAAAIAGGILGIGCAFAAEELSPAPVRGAILASIEFLGAMPAVAFGWFAASAISRLTKDQIAGASTPFVAASIVLAIMVAPTACALATRALRRLPDAVRHAAAAAGASRLQTTALVMMPALRRRLAAATLAAFARAAGEATALQILFAVLVRNGGLSSATLASWIFSTATFAPSPESAARLALPALLLFALSIGCALLVARESRGIQWA
jgi:phosphate transport system permease protein